MKMQKLTKLQLEEWPSKTHSHVTIPKVLLDMVKNRVLEDTSWQHDEMPCMQWGIMHRDESTREFQVWIQSVNNLEDGLRSTDRFAVVQTVGSVQDYRQIFCCESAQAICQFILDTNSACPRLCEDPSKLQVIEYLEDLVDSNYMYHLDDDLDDFDNFTKEEQKALHDDRETVRDKFGHDFLWINLPRKMWDEKYGEDE